MQTNSNVTPMQVKNPHRATFRANKSKKKDWSVTKEPRKQSDYRKSGNRKVAVWDGL